MAKTYLITGATSDVGLLLIQRLLENGNNEDIIIAQGHSNLQMLAPLAKKFKGQVRTFSVNLQEPKAVNVFLNEAGRSCPLPTHIVHLPAMPVVNTKFKNFDEDYFAKDMQVQVTSAISICKHFLPKMAKAKYGRVLFMATSYILGVPPKNTASYVVVKQALQGFANSLAADYAPFGITVNSVAPSMIETKFLKNTPGLIVQASAADNPMKRNATPSDVVPAMQFLLSDEAGFITGATLPITGGGAF